MKTQHLLLLLLGFSLMSCATGKNAFEKGNYETAISRAVNRLQNNPDNKKSKAVLREGYALASEYHLDYVKQLEASNDPNRYEAIFYQYGQLNDYYQKIRRCPACMRLVNPVSYQTQQQDAGELAASHIVSQGNAALNTNTIQGGREAYHYFAQATRFDNDLVGIQDLMNQARDMGTVKVLVERIPIHSRALELSNEFFENRILEFLDRYSSNRFVYFFTEDEAQQENAPRADQILSLKFDDFVIGQTLIETNTREVTRDSVIVGEYKDDSGRVYDVYGPVKAEITQSRKTLSSAGVMNFEIRDAYSNRVLAQRKLPSEDVWIYEWASFNGDERALTKEELRLTRLKEGYPPGPQTLFISFVDRIFDQIRGNVRNFYRNTQL